MNARSMSSAAVVALFRKNSAAQVHSLSMQVARRIAVLAIALLSSTSFTSAASAGTLTSIGAQFRGGTDQHGGGTGSVSLTSDQTAGVPGFQQDNWNV